MEPQPEPESDSPTQPTPNRFPNLYDEIREDEEDDESDLEDDDDDDDYDSMTPDARGRNEQAKMESLFKRLATERVPVHVHDIIIRGNTRTKESLIEAEAEEVLRMATTFQQLLRAAGVANARLRALEIFDSVSVTLDAGPPELPGTANVIIEVLEPTHPLAGNIGVFTKPGVFYLICVYFLKL